MSGPLARRGEWLLPFRGLLLLLGAISAGCGRLEDWLPDQRAPQGVVGYSANPALAGDLLIGASFDEPLAGAPLIEVRRPGVDLPEGGSMTGGGAEWLFLYPVVPAGGMDVLEQPLTVVVSNIVDQAGNRAEALVDDTAFVHAPASASVEASLSGLEFAKHDQPALEAGPPGAWDAGGVDLGDVLKVGDTYWMYYAGHSAEGHEAAIGLATSSDGLNWIKWPEPVLSPGLPGEWNSQQVFHPSVLWENGLFHMWYVGFPEGGDMVSFRFGHTTSADGVRWEPATPVLGPGPAGAWDEERIGGLDAVKIDGVFYLYYTATSLTPEFVRWIGCATSQDGETWLKCEANPLFGPRPRRAPFEGNEVEGPNVISFYGLWLMAYTGYGGLQGANFEIGLARSADGLTWERLGDQPALPWGPPGSFVEAGTKQPALLVEGNRLWMWYTGLSDDGGAVAVAVALLD